MTKLRIKRFIIECSEHDAAILNDGWDIIPAPPNDWRPVCYNYSELVEGCAQIPWADKPQCHGCPYREVRP